MCGWFRAAVARASRAKRSLNWAWEIFSATIRSSRLSRALKTWPIPPSPIGAITWYGPKLRAGSIDMHGHCTRETRSDAVWFWGAALSNGRQLDGPERLARAQMFARPGTPESPTTRHKENDDPATSHTAINCRH